MQLLTTPPALRAERRCTSQAIFAAAPRGRRLRAARTGSRLAVAATPSGDTKRAAKGAAQKLEGKTGDDFFASVAYVPRPEDDRKLPFNMPHRLPQPAELPRPRQRRELRNRQLPGPRDNPAPGLAASIRDLAPGDGVEEVLDGNAQRLGRFDAARIISLLGQMKAAGRAAEVFRWLAKRDDSRLYPDDVALCAAIQVMAQAGDLECACELAECVQENPGLVCRTLAVALAEAGRFEGSLKVLERVEREGLGFDVGPVFAKLVVEASRQGFQNLVLHLLERMENKDLCLGLEDSSAVMVACSKMGLAETAEAFFDSFKARGLQPNVVMYTALISVRERARKYRAAAAVVWDMEQANCPLDLMGYRVVMRVLGHLEDLPMAAKMYSRMKSDGFSPTLDIYDVVIKLHCKHERWGKAKEVLKEMEMKGLTPSEKIRAYFTE